MEFKIRLRLWKQDYRVLTVAIPYPLHRRTSYYKGSCLRKIRPDGKDCP